ncbi:hypothetical protein ACQPW3_09425 [Actinosynnema sp. CA-248983]
MDPKLAEELRLLLDAAAERAQPWLHKLSGEGGGSVHGGGSAHAGGEHAPGTCGWCPLCNAVALVRGDRSELAAKAAEHVAGLIAVLRAALAEPEPAPPDEPAEAKPRVQRIPVVRKKSSPC